MWTQHLLSEQGQKEIAKVKELTKIAEQGEDIYLEHGWRLTGVCRLAMQHDSTRPRVGDQSEPLHKHRDPWSHQAPATDREPGGYRRFAQVDPGDYGEDREGVG